MIGIKPLSEPSRAPTNHDDHVKNLVKITPQVIESLSKTHACKTWLNFSRGFLLGFLIFDKKQLRSLVNQGVSGTSVALHAVDKIV